MSARLIVASALLALPGVRSAPRAQDADDPLTGVWEGKITGDLEEIPAGGLPVTFVIERVDEFGAIVRLSFEEGRMQGLAEADFDPVDGLLEFQVDLMGILVDVEATVADGVLEGEAAGLGHAAAVRAERVSREVPAELEAPAPVPVADPFALSTEDWVFDLHALNGELPARHVNAFHAVSKEDWEAAVRELEERLPSLDGPSAAVALAQLVARVGDAHTELGWQALPGWFVLPVRFGIFAEGVHVIAIDDRWGDALATRVLRIGNASAAEAIDAVATTFAVENDSWKRAKAPQLLALPRLLVALGILESESELPLVVEIEPGVEETIVVGPAVAGSRAVQAPDPASDPIPPWLGRAGEGYWFDVLDGPTLYLAYNRCYEDPSRPIGGFARELFTRFDEAGAERLIVDLRNNSGGNSSVLRPVLDGIEARSRLAEPGRLVALIGPRTYSSGVHNAVDLDRLGAVLVGEPTGGCPNSYGEVRSFQLPRSGLSVHYSTKLFRLVDEDVPSIAPDVSVPLDAEAYFSGRDPVLERALGDFR